MKNIFIIGAALFMSIIPIFSTHASQMPNDSSSAVTYKIQTKEIINFEKSGITRFNFQPSGVVNPEAIDHWKILVYCDEVVFISVDELKENSCGKKVSFSRDLLNGFFLSFSKKSNKKAFFSFKLKAYDKDDNWLYTEKKAFLLK